MLGQCADREALDHLERPLRDHIDGVRLAVGHVHERRVCAHRGAQCAGAVGRVDVVGVERRRNLRVRTRCRCVAASAVRDAPVDARRTAASSRGRFAATGEQQPGHQQAREIIARARLLRRATAHGGFVQAAGAPSDGLPPGLSRPRRSTYRCDATSSPIAHW